MYHLYRTEEKTSKKLVIIKHPKMEVIANTLRTSNPFHLGFYMMFLLK
jgi:hypothetical protein